MSGGKDRISELRGFFDLWDFALLFGLAIIIGIPFLPAVISLGELSLSVPQYSFSPVAVFTALYVFFAFKMMRNEGGIASETQTIRRDFNDGDFGLRNFGPGPALYLRVHATVESEGPEHTIEESDEPLHLEEGEFLSVLKGDLAELQDPDSELFEKADASRIELYYTWESPSGKQCPPGLKNPRGMSADELREQAEEPRSEELENLHKNFSEDSKVIKESTL